MLPQPNQWIFFWTWRVVWTPMRPWRPISVGKVRSRTCQAPECIARCWLSKTACCHTRTRMALLGHAGLGNARYGVQWSLQTVFMCCATPEGVIYRINMPWWQKCVSSRKTNAVDEANLELIFEQSVAQFFFTYRLGSFGMFRTLNDPSLAEVACWSKKSCGCYLSFTHARFVLFFLGGGGHPVPIGGQSLHFNLFVVVFYVLKM